MILREHVKCWSKGGQRGFSWRFRWKKNRGAFGGFYGVKHSKYIGNISMRKENLNF